MIPPLCGFEQPCRDLQTDSRVSGYRIHGCLDQYQAATSVNESSLLGRQLVSHAIEKVLQ
jgi:hypothetical protein